MRTTFCCFGRFLPWGGNEGRSFKKPNRKKNGRAPLGTFFASFLSQSISFSPSLPTESGIRSSGVSIIWTLLLRDHAPSVRHAVRITHWHWQFSCNTDVFLSIIFPLPRISISLIACYSLHWKMFLSAPPQVPAVFIT